MSVKTIEQIDPAALRPWTGNARTHSKRQIRQIAESIRTFGFTSPVLVDEENIILAGHGRVEAARHLAMSKVPCVRLGALTTKQKRAYVLADNKIALNAGWDEAILAEELSMLVTTGLEFDVEVTGFSLPEIDSRTGDRNPSRADVDEFAQRGDEVARKRTAATSTVADPVRSRPGDVWRLGQHRLACADGPEADPADCDRIIEFWERIANDKAERIAGGMGANERVSDRPNISDRNRPPV